MLFQSYPRLATPLGESAQAAAPMTSLMNRASDLSEKDVQGVAGFVKQVDDFVDAHQAVRMIVLRLLQVHENRAVR